MPDTIQSRPNPQIQHACGVLLLIDGTCPACEPVAQRSLDDQEKLARAYKDTAALANIARQREARGQRPGVSRPMGAGPVTVPVPNPNPRPGPPAGWPNAELDAGAELDDDQGGHELDEERLRAFIQSEVDRRVAYALERLVGDAVERAMASRQARVDAAAPAGETKP